MDQMEELVKQVRESGAKKVMLQLPEGLKLRCQEISRALEKEGIETFVSLEPCFGACDLRDHEAGLLGCDLLVHVGHSDFGLNPSLPVLYFPWFVEADPIPALGKGVGRLDGFKNIGLITSVNYMHLLPQVKEFLEKNGKKCFIGEGRYNPGQVLGCDIRAALNVQDSVDCFLFVGSGKFHYLGVGIKEDIPLFSLDIERNELLDVSKEKDRFLRQKYLSMALSKDAQTFGIILSSKEGQAYVQAAESIKKRLEGMGKEAYVFVMDLVTQDKLFFAKVDCFVNCACPRISVEDRGMFRKPILGIDEFWEVFGKEGLKVLTLQNI